ncbi:post-GPI attachment to proteins factor 2-like [Patella vulgata]|uniref:post-GPI attachment to proteins factor 2-like n=1 Tax=Patella vulgata TaxID=6465 RepID=UPI00217F326C|nr:post-GPI attachment to proteins factor 2-like [Patella vulgata]
MSTASKGRTENISNVLLRVPILTYAIITVSLPGAALFLCFVTAVIFQYEDVNDTQCNVTNFVPSISAVTGIRPQTYLWRICIALHSAPRFAIAVVYFNYYKNLQHLISTKYLTLFNVLLHVNFWFNTIENSSLVGVTYISNKENYPVHEKIFIVFMVLSLCYMLINTILFRWTRTSTLTPDEKQSFKWKTIMFLANFWATMGLLYFFVLHRFYCRPLAFSGFSVCEYIIGYTNMAYHFTAYLDFKHLTLAMGSLEPVHSNGTVSNNNKKKE